MKKLLSGFLVMMMLLSNALASGAAVIKKDKLGDVPQNYWANVEIQDMIRSKIMQPDENYNFNPEKKVPRIEFLKGLLKTLGNEDMEVTIKNQFKDINSKTYGYEDIMRSEQLNLVFGYKNRTFMPQRIITKAEAASVISHITLDTPSNQTFLDRFTDKKDIPSWAVDCFAKSVGYNIYVAYPDPNMLLPNKDLTRAEMAVLLYKLRNAMGVVSDRYKGNRVKETTERAEHLNISKNADSDIVLVTNLRRVIKAGNVLKVAFSEDFYSKRSSVNDEIVFVMSKDLFTEEGTMVFQAGTKFKAQIQELKDPQWFNKNAMVRLLFNEVELVDGRKVPIEAVVVGVKDGVLTESRWEKPAIYTIANTVASTGSAIGIAAIPSEKKWGEAVAIGVPVGAGVGLIAGLVTPGVNYKGKEGRQILIKVTQDLSVFYGL